MVGPHTAAIGFRAAVNSNGFFSMRWTEVGFYAGRVMKLKGQGKYLTKTHRLGYDVVQVTVWSRPEDGFLPCISEEAVWQVINSPPFTTPLRRQWLPWLIGRMKEERQVRELQCFNCNSGMFYLQPEGLDELVSEGLRKRAITIQ